VEQAFEVKFFQLQEVFCAELLCGDEPGAESECLPCSHGKACSRLGNQSEPTATALKVNQWQFPAIPLSPRNLYADLETR